MPVQTSYFTSTSTDYRDLLNDISTFITNDQVATVAINAGGTGYSVNDIITLSGGTSITPATFLVTAVSGGAITALEVHNAGSYSVNTGSTNIATTGGNADATVDVTYQTPWTLDRKLVQLGAVNATIVSGGTGHAVNDTLTGVSGTGTKYTLNVDTVSSGVITSVSIVTAGEYTVAPTNPDTTTSSGAGTGATFTITMDGEVGEDQYLFTGIGSGSDTVRVGIRTYKNSGASSHGWELAGMTGRNNLTTWVGQPDISPGRHDAATSSIEGGAFVPLADTTITYWVNMTGRRIILCAKISTTYSSMYLGFIDPTGTLSELSYPLLVGGCVNAPDTRFSTIRQGFASICFPVGKGHQLSVVDPGDLKNGPLMLRTAAGNWETFCNSHEQTNSTSATTIYQFRVVVPPGTQGPNASLPAENDSWISTATLEWNDMSRNATTVTTTDTEMRQTPDSGGDQIPLFVQSLTQRGSSGINIGEQIYGELSGVKWAPIYGTSAVAEDTVTVGNIVHILFQSGLKTEAYHFWAMETR